MSWFGYHYKFLGLSVLVIVFYTVYLPSCLHFEFSVCVIYFIYFVIFSCISSYIFLLLLVYFFAFCDVDYFALIDVDFDLCVKIIKIYS